MKGISVVIIVKERYLALCRTMTGLKKSLYPPVEFILVNMNQVDVELSEMPFPVRQVSIECTAKLPLAAARNAGMAAACCERVVFLDVDCIPAPDMLSVYAQEWVDDQLLSGQIRYLPANASERSDEPENLYADSVVDPIRSGLTGLPYELFWSLNFGCSKTLFSRIGRFDENYLGYGAEDTDFAFAAREKCVLIKSVPAIAYHQYHDSYSPPLNHLLDIVLNANRFYAKWRQWPMAGWLAKFEESGLISRKDGDIKLLRIPSAEEVQQALKT